MAGILLALFPVLLMVNTPLAFVVLAVAIGLLCNKRFTTGKRPRHPRVQNDASI